MTLTQSINTADKTKSEMVFDTYEDFKKDKSIPQKSFINFQSYIKSKNLGLPAAQLGDIFEDLGNPKKKQEIIDKLEKKTPEVEKTEQPIKKLNEYTKEELENESAETIKKIVTKDLAEKAMDDAKKGDKLDIKQGKEDLIAKYTALLDEKNILEKQNKKLKEVVFDKTELIISPREYLKRLRLSNMSERIEKLKKTDYPKSAVIYFMSMMKFRDGGRV
ncbi:TPA: hypothetical protein DCZ39_07200 [Patescibacteria group bacterium]|nr:hypothetical protein [Candidatus Gracilibacteria bacterium]